MDYVLNWADYNDQVKPAGKDYLNVKPVWPSCVFVATMLIRLDMYLVFLFVSVIIVFLYDNDRYGTPATSGEELFMITISWFQSLFFVIGGFVWYVLAAPHPPLTYIYI